MYSTHWFWWHPLKFHLRLWEQLLLACHPMETKCLVTSKPEISYTGEFFCPSGTALFHSESEVSKMGDSNTKYHARESPRILVLPLLLSEINTFLSQETCTFFWLSLTFGWIPAVHIHNSWFPQCLNEPERLCLLKMGSFNPIYGTLYQSEIASVRSLNWTTTRFTATAEELAGWVQTAISSNHILLK